MLCAYSFLEGWKSNAPLLLALHWIIKQDSGVENVNLSISEDLDLW